MSFGSYPAGKVKAIIYSRAIAVDDEGDVDVSSVLEVGNMPIGVVLGIRAHAQRPDWSVLLLDRPVRGVYRGDVVKHVPVPRAKHPLDQQPSAE